VPVLRLNPAFEVLDRADLYVVTLIALVSPVLCFVIGMARHPRRLWSFLTQRWDCRPVRAVIQVPLS
jgi:hypothetical protein